LKRRRRSRVAFAPRPQKQRSTSTSSSASFAVANENDVDDDEANSNEASIVAGFASFRGCYPRLKRQASSEAEEEARESLEAPLALLEEKEKNVTRD